MAWIFRHFLLVTLLRLATFSFLGSLLRLIAFLLPSFNSLLYNTTTHSR